MRKLSWIIAISVLVLILISYTTIKLLPTPKLNTPQPLSSPSPTQTAQTQNIKVYVVKTDGKGTVGCGDTLVALDRTVTKTPAILRTSIDELLALKQTDLPDSEHYTAFHNANLKTESVLINNGKAIIKLTGSLSLGGVCDSPRVTEQLSQTALQFPTVTSVEVFINNQPLKDILSQKG